MVNWVQNKTLPYIKIHARQLEYLMIKHLFQNQEDAILSELKKFQNEDGGFGHGLEPDSMIPLSCVVHTNIAIDYLKEIHNEEKKAPMIKGIVQFFESSYREPYKGWYLTTEEIDQYPRAFWWNFDGIESFTYGNPTPQVVGFLYQYQRYMKKLDITVLVNQVIDYIKDEWIDEVGDHSLMSMLEFYYAMPNDIQEEIKPYMMEAMDRTIETDSDRWDEYVCEPHKVISSKEALGYKDYKQSLKENLLGIKYELKRYGYAEPNWSWGQFETEWETIARPAWVGVVTFGKVRLLKNFDMLD